jgi:hypothetical protein
MLSNLNSNMKKILLVVLTFLVFNPTYGQILPANRYYNTPYLLDLTTASPSFAYSLRKVKRTYSGFAIKVRRGTDNAEANVAFDNFNIVSTTSNVTITAVGSSGFTLGQTMSYSTFVGAQTIFVVTWYDQGSNAYHATQTTNTLQPTLVLNSVSPSNKLPSILFDGTAPPDFLDVGQPIENITTSGINGSFMLICKPTQNTSQLSFGVQLGSWRWAFHFNWSDANCYFDSGEVCCAGNRAFANGGNLNVYNQYSFVRGTTYKTARVNSGATSLNNSAAASTANAGGSFLLGAWSGAAASTGFFGNASEIIMFPTDLTNAQLLPLESNQINFWK